MSFAAQILTLYPEMFPGPLGVSLAGRALSEGKWSCDPIHIRDFATDKHRTVDDTPAGGGAGMVLRADIVGLAIDHALEKRPDLPVIAMTPRGRPITQGRVRELAAGPGATILCGRFEGFDERIFEARPVEQISMGDIILSGGEMGALMLLDACIRLLPVGMKRASKAAFLNIHTIPGPLCGKGARSLKCCDRGIMRRSPPGGNKGRRMTHG